MAAEWRQQQEQEEQRLLEELEENMTIEQRLALHKKLFPITKDKAKYYDNRRAKKAF